MLLKARNVRLKGGTARDGSDWLCVRNMVDVGLTCPYLRLTGTTAAGLVVIKEEHFEMSSFDSPISPLDSDEGFEKDLEDAMGEPEVVDIM